MTDPDLKDLRIFHTTYIAGKRDQLRPDRLTFACRYIFRKLAEDPIMTDFARNIPVTMVGLKEPQPVERRIKWLPPKASNLQVIKFHPIILDREIKVPTEEYAIDTRCGTIYPNLKRTIATPPLGYLLEPQVSDAHMEQQAIDHGSIDKH